MSLDIQFLLQERDKIQRLDRSRPIGIYGAGGFGRGLAKKLALNGFSVSCFFDRRAVDSRILDELPVLHAEMLSRDPNLQVVIGVFNRDVCPRLLHKEIKDLGAKTVIDLTSLAYAEPGLGLKSFWLDPSVRFVDNIDEILAVRDRLGDLESVSLFDQILSYRISGDVTYHPTGTGLSTQYFDVHVPNWATDGDVSLIDCGAYDGDSLRLALEKKIRLKRAICLEPDLKNFDALAEYGRTLKDVDLTMLPCGTWDRTARLSFGGNGEASRISAESSDHIISVVRLDDALSNAKFNLLKLDVEGAERETLLGARNLIQKQKPCIAISAYHKPRDLWELPKVLDSISSGYKLFLRQHGQYTFDGVFYAVPTTR